MLSIRGHVIEDFSRVKDDISIRIKGNTNLKGMSGGVCQV